MAGVVEVGRSVGCANPENHFCLSCGVSMGRIWWVHTGEGSRSEAGAAEGWG